MPVKSSQSSRVTICQGTSSILDPTKALEDLFTQCDIRSKGVTGPPQLTQVFFAENYDHSELCKVLSSLPGTVVGCSSAGQLTSNGFQKDGISAMRLSSSYFKAISYLIKPLDNLVDQVEVIAADVRDRLQFSKQQAFGLLLVDGLSTREEALSATLYRALGDVPIVGGSAGDKLRFENTYLYHNGELLQDCAVFTLCMTSLPFTVFKHQHFESTVKRLVITEAIPEQRLVQEINGEIAVQAYAHCIGVPVDELNASVFSQYPLMLRIGEDYFVRSIAGVEDDGSLKFYCAIDKGLVLTVGQGTSAVQALESSFQKVREEIGEPVLIFGCDCILRRLEMEESHIDKEIGSLMAKNHVFGFNTYGEQYNSLHVNQTFTGVALGG
nr:FIST N-terminal domain-containing protein [uncultured Desulfobulbus sp.]